MGLCRLWRVGCEALRAGELGELGWFLWFSFLFGLVNWIWIVQSSERIGS